MTLRTTQRGLFGMVIGIFLVLPSGVAMAQEPPTTQPTEGTTQDQPERHPETQEALERLLRLRDQMETERKAREDAGEKPKPPRRSVRDRRTTTEEERKRRAARLEELRARARASTQAARLRAGEHGVPDDFVGPPESLANEPPVGVASETQPGVTLLPDTVAGKTPETAAESKPAAEPTVAEESKEEPVAKAERKPRERRPKSETDKEQWFTFVDMPWEDVVLHFVERIGKPLMDQEDLYVGGTLTYVNEQKFTKEEALDELNLLLHEKEFLFVEREHHIYLVPLNEMSGNIDLSHVYPSVQAFNEADPRDMEYVTVYYQVPDRKAQILVEAFLDALPAYTRLSALDDSNQIKMVALARDVRKFLTLEQMIDISPQDPRKLKVFEIKTNARDIERMVREFMNLGSGRGSVQFVRDRRTGRMVPQATGGGEKSSDVQMIADDRTNSIIAKATDDKLEEIKLLIEQFDQKPDLGEFDTRVVEVEHADAVEVANLLNQIFQQEQGQGQAQTPAWQRLRALQQRQARQRGRRTTRQPTRTTPQAQATTPEDIMAQGIFERAKKTIRLVAEPRQNLLFVYANEEGHTRVREMLKDIDKPQSENFQTFVLEHAKVRAIAPVLTQIVSGMTASGVRTGRGGPHLVPDEGKNQFYVIADRDQMERIGQLIERLDVPGPAQQRHVVELENLRPSDVAQMVQTLLGGSGGSSVRSSISRGMRGRRGRMPMTPIGGSVAAELQVIPLDDAQLLIVICSDEEWAKVEDTIQLWDEKALTNSPKLESFTIENGNAQSIAATLSGMYRSYFHPAFGRSSVFIQAEGNKVLVYGIRPAMEEIRPLIEALDTEDGSKYEILPLAHADANTVAQEAMVLFAAGGARGGRFSRGGGMAGGVVIQAEPTTNSLIVQADAATLEKIKDYALARDQQVGEQTPDRKFYSVEHVSPRDVLSAINSLFGTGAGRGRFRGQPMGTRVKAVIVGNEVVVDAPAEKQREIEALIQQLDDLSDRGITTLLVKMPGANVNSIAGRLGRAFQDRVRKQGVTARFEPDSSTETILVTHSKDVKEDVEKLLEEYKTLSEGLVNQTEFYQLKHASATEVASWLRSELVTMMTKQFGRSAAQQVKVTPDNRTNRIIISAPQVAVTAAMPLLEQYDVEQEVLPAKSLVETVTRKLPGLDVGNLANQLNQQFRERNRQRSDKLKTTFGADRLTEMLIITTPKDTLQEIDELIAKFVAETEDLQPEQKFIDIQNADANYVATQMRNILNVRISGRRGQDVARRVNVQVEPRLNRVIINAPKFAIEMAEALVAELDRESTTVSQLQTIPLEHADAGQIYNVLRTIFQEKIRARTLQVSVEPLTNSLIVGGVKEDFEDIQQWAKKLDEQAALKISPPRIYDLKNANPWEVNGVLQATFVQKGWGRKLPPSKQIKISIVGGRSIVVQAPQEKLQDIEDLIQKLDELQSNQTVVRTYQLPGLGPQLSGLARDIRNAVNVGKQARERPVSITPFPQADTLIISAMEDQFDKVEQFMEQFKGLYKPMKIETIALLHGDANMVYQALNRVLQPKIRAGKMTLGVEGMTNSLIVSAADEDMAEIREWVAKFEEAAKVAITPPRIFEIQNANPWEVRNILHATFLQSGTARRRGGMEIRFDVVGGRSIVAKAPAEKMKEIEDLIKQLDELVSNKAEMRTYELAGMGNRLNDFARQLQNQLNQQVQARERRVSVTTYPPADALIVTAQPDQFEQVEQMMEQLKPLMAVTKAKTEFFQLENVDAGQIVNLVRDLVQKRSQAGGRRGSQDFTVMADPRTNRLIVFAPESILPDVRTVVAELDVEVADDTVVTVVLEYADPWEVRNMINDVFGQRGQRRGQSQQQQVYVTVSNNTLVIKAPPKKLEQINELIARIDAEDSGGLQIKTYQLKVLNATQVAVQVQSYLRGMGGVSRRGQMQPGAFAEPTTNTLVVIAPPRHLPFIEGLVTKLEASDRRDSETRAYVLKNVRAEQVSQNLDQMLKAKVAEREGQVRGRTMQMRTAVFSDVNSNRLFVYAPDEYQELAGELIKMVDEEVATGEIIHIVPLDDGDAQQLAQSLNQVLGAGGGRRGRGGGAAGRVRITADVGSNSLLIGGLPRDVAEAEELITELEGNSVRVPELQLFELEYAMAEEVEQTLQNIFGGARNPQDQVTVTADAYTGRLMVTANKRKMRQVEAFIKQLDQEPEGDFLMGGKQLYFVDVNRGSASDIAWDVRDLLPDEYSGGPSIEADWFDEYLIVKCRPSEFAKIEELIRQFERRAKPEMVQRLISLRGADTDAILAYLMKRYEGEDNLVVERPPEKPKMERLIVDVWGEDEAPEGATDEDRTRGSTGGRRIAPFQTGLPLAQALLDDDGGDPPSRQTAASQPAPEAAEPEDNAAGREPGQTIESPIKKEPTRVVWQEDGTLLLYGTRDDVDDINNAIELFMEERSVGEVIRIFRFKYGDVTAAAEILSIMFDVRRQQIVIPQQQQRGRQQGREDEQGRRQPTSMLEQLQGMVGGRQRGQQRGQQQQLRIATDPGHNYLIIKCDETYLPEIHQLLRELDIPPGKVEVKVFQLRNLLAEETAGNIKDVLGISKVQQRRAPTPRRGGRGNQQQQLMEMLQRQMVSVPGVEGGAKVERVEIVPNSVTNALMVSAPPEVMGLIESVINELEGLEGRDVVGIHHYDLLHAKVDDILPLLQQIFDATTGGGGGGGPRRGGRGGGASPASMGPVTISGDPRTNTLIFTAEGKDADTVKAQIAKLDIAGAVAEAEMYVCQYGDAEAIASVVEAVFGGTTGGRPQRGRGGRQARAPAATGTDVRIVAEAATNTILIWGPLDKRDLIFAKIEELDRLSKRDIREIAVIYADPEELAQKLMEVFGSGAGGGRQVAARRGGRGGRGQRPTGGGLTSGRVMIMGDKDAKKLLVRAPDEVYTQIEEIVATLDQPSEQMKLRRYQLEYADATQVVDSVKAAMTEFLQLSRSTGDEVDFDAFTAMPDPRTNSITVVGTDKTFLFVSEVLAAVDVETPEDQKKEFRIFLLEKADAATVAEVINGFATGGAGATTPSRRGGRGRGASALPGGARELTVYAVPEETTNSVMVIGRMEDIDRVEKEVIEKLEDSISDRYQIATVPVKNVPPSQIVSFIWQFIDQGMVQAQAGGRGGGRRGGRTAGRTGGLADDGGPQIVPNDNGGTLIVRGTKRQIDEIRGLVERFDDKDIVTQTIRVIEIPRGQDATRLAADIQTIVNESEQNIAEQTGRRPRLVTVGADEYTNTLIVAGDPTAFGMVETIINQLRDVRSGGEVTRVIEFRNLSADDAEQIINDLQQNRRGSSGTRRGTPRGGGSRPRRRGSLTPNQLPGADQQPLLVPALAFVEPYIGVGPFMPLIGLLTVPQWDDDEPVPVRLGDLRRVVLASLNQEEPGTQPARRPTRRAFGRPASEQEPRAEQPRSQEPRPEPATLPAGITDTLSGVSGALKGEVTAKAVDSRRIIITGDEEDVEFIEQILLMMEQSAPAPLIEVFALENAKATALAPIIETAVKAQIDARTTAPGPQDRFSINAEGRSNSLIASASEKLMAEIADLIEKLDIEDPSGGTDFRTIALKNIRAVEAVAQLKPVIEKLMQQRDIPKESQVSISAIERSNSVMIVGTPKDVEDVERMVLAVDIKLAEDDEQASFVSADVVLLQLKNGQAEDIAKVLTEMIEEQQENARKADPEKPGEPFVKILRLRMADGRELPPLNLDRPIKILPEEGTNSLIVFSSKENNEALAAIVDVFDTLPIGVETDVKAFVLLHASAEEIAKLIEDIFKEKSYLLRPSEGDSGGLQEGRLPPIPPGVAAKGLPYPLVVQHDARSNTVIVIGRSDAVILAGGLISELDRPTTDLGLKAYVLELKYMQATQVAEKLEQLLDDRAKALGGENEARDSAVIQPEERTNSLLVFAAEEVYDMIEELVLELDAARKYSVVDVRYRLLKYADASKLQGFLQETFDAKQQAEKETNKEANDSLTVMADTRTNSLLMTGTRDYLDEAEDLIAKLDEEGDATVVFRALKVRLNSAANIAALLKDMVEEALEQQDSKLKGTPIHIAADPISDSLLIAAAREDIELIERWVEILDRPSEVGRMTKIIPLRRAPAEDVSKAVQEVFKQGGGQQDGQVDLTVTADETTNSVVVFGPPALVNDIEGFVRQLDGIEPSSGVMVRLFKLQQADAEDAGDLLTRILDLEGGSVGGTSRGGGGSRQDAAQQVMLIYQQEHPELGTETLKGWREDIIVISDLRTNSLVIEAPPESMPLMESLVAAVDVPPDAAKIRVFHLRNADAEQMVNTLKELFERETVGAGRAGDETARELVLGEGLTGGRQEIAFTHDIRTNSVIAAGTPGYLDIVEKFVLELDTIPIEERETFVYAPRNIPAADLATSLKEFSDEEQQRLEEIGDEVSIARRQERKIVAIANEEANRVIFDVDPRFKMAVLDVVRELDQPPPQVMIQVLIVEVTMDNELDLGVEFAFQDLQYAKAGPTDTTTFDYVGGTDIGAAGSGLGGFSFTVTGADFNFLFRTLQNEGNLQVLSRPQIVAMDNQEAMIDISDDVPYVAQSSTSTTGQVTTSVNRERIGIKLTVTPQINPDGFVRMEVTQEVSDFTGSTVDVGQGVTAPVFFRREAKTVISVKDNETVVMGGLITSRKENREQKVPILGDIPGLGLLFRNQNDTSRRTELLLVMTPHVVRTVDDYRTFSLVERERMEVIPTEVLTSPLMQHLRVSDEELASIEAGGGDPDLIDRVTPVEQAEQPTDELYGPLRPALRPERPEEPVDPDSYDVPLSMSGPPKMQHQ